VKMQTQLDALAAANLGVPLILGGVPTSLMNLDMLSAKGVRVCLQGHQPFQAATQAIYDTLRALREGTTSAELRGLASAQTMARVTREGEYVARIGEWLGGRG
jgi:oxaloacetate decarboxylase